MKNILPLIAENVYGSSLLNILLNIRIKNDDTRAVNALIFLCSSDLNSFTHNQIDSALEEILYDCSNILGCKNKEIIARWNDFLFIKNKGDKRNNINTAVFNYLDVFESTTKNIYLIRALKLVRLTKGLFQEKLEDIYNYSRDVVLNCDGILEQYNILKELNRLKPELTKSNFETYLLSKLTEYKTKNYNEEERIVINTLKDISLIDNVKYKILIAESLEREADYQNSNKSPNTFYPNILKLLTDALREIKGVKYSSDLRKRLEIKINIEQTASIQMYKACGISSTINRKIIDQIIVSEKIDSFKTGLEFLIKYPLIKTEYITSYANENKNKYVFSQFMDKAHLIDPKGKVVGISSIDEYNKHLVRSIHRSYTIDVVKNIKWFMDLDKVICKRHIHAFISRCNCKFIPENRVYMFVEGIYAGFKNEFITSAHILMPQIENSLKYIANKNNITVAKLAENIQHDNTLGGILDKVRHLIPTDLYEELKSFLVDTNGVNFRNELSHGIMEPTIVQHYGIYLWWLSLKMIVNADKYFNLN